MARDYNMTHEALEFTTNVYGCTTRTNQQRVRQPTSSRQPWLRSRHRSLSDSPTRTSIGISQQPFATSTRQRSNHRPAAGRSSVRSATMAICSHLPEPTAHRPTLSPQPLRERFLAPRRHPSRGCNHRISPSVSGPPTRDLHASILRRNGLPPLGAFQGARPLAQPRCVCLHAILSLPLA